MTRKAALASLALAACATQPGPDPVAIRLDEALTAAEAHDRFYGSAILARDGEVLLREAYGPATEDGTPATPGTLYNVGSVGKLFTQVLVLDRVEDGTLSLDTTVDEAWPQSGLPNADKVTVEDLLAHSSGYGDYFGHPDYSLEQRTIDDFLELVRTQEPRFLPGEGFAYSNSAFWVLARLLERTDPGGRSWQEQFEEEVFSPAGMDGIRMFQPDEDAPARPDGFVLKPTGEVETVFDDPRPGPDGGFYATADDLLAFDRALREGLWYGDETFEESIRARGHFASLGADVGLVWELQTIGGEPFVTKGGTTTGGGAEYARFEQEGEPYTLIMLSNLSNAPLLILKDVVSYALAQPGAGLPGPSPLVTIVAGVESGELGAMEADFAAWAAARDISVEPIPLLQAGLHFMKAGETETARSILTIAAEAFPDNELPARLLARLD